MKKLFTIIMMALAFVMYNGGQAKADFTPWTNSITTITQYSDNIIINNIIDWKVGDISTYDLDMGFIKGSMVKESVKDENEALWVNTVVDMKIAKQKIETLIRRIDGKVLKVIINGKEQAPPEEDDIKIIEQRYEKIEVPAGIFPCVYIKANVGDTKGIEIWISETPTVMENMVKTIMPSQFGKITLELKSFHKVD